MIPLLLFIVVNTIVIAFKIEIIGKLRAVIEFFVLHYTMSKPAWYLVIKELHVYYVWPGPI